MTDSSKHPFFSGQPQPQQHINSHVWAYVSFVDLLWSPVAVIDTIILQRLSPSNYILWSTISGAVGALALNIIKRNTVFLLSYNLFHHGKLFLLSMLGFAGYFFMKYMAYINSPVPKANVLQFTFTIFIVIFAVPLLKKRVSPLQFTGVIVGFCGAAFIISGGRLTGYEKTYIHGYLFALGAGIFFALFSVLSERWSYDRLSSLFYYHAYTALLVFIVVFMEGRSNRGSKRSFRRNFGHCVKRNDTRSESVQKKAVRELGGSQLSG